MSFPFGRDVHALRQRLLFAIGGGGLLGLAVSGCSSSAGDKADAQVANPPSAGTHSAGSGSSGSGGSGGTGGSSGTSSTAGSAGMSMSKPDAGSPTCWSGGAPVAKMCWSRNEMESKATFGCGMFPTMPEPTAADVAAAFLPNGCLPKEMACDSCCNPGMTDGVPMGDGSCCYQYCQGACCGRPFDVEGEARMAGVSTRTDWLGAFPPIAPAAEARELPGWLARRIAGEWLDDARMEHASIASFARFTLDLLAAGAPAALLAQAQQAALDEVAHAELCFALASRYGGSAYGPAALRTSDCRPAASLHDALLSAFSEGCIGETLAAAHARCSLAHARDPQVRSALERIAEDEARHAELAWRFVAWGVQRCGTDVQAALRSVLSGALDAQPAPASEHEDLATLDALHGAGRLTASERADVSRRTLREVVVPCAEALLQAAVAADLRSPQLAGGGISSSSASSPC